MSFTKLIYILSMIDEEDNKEDVCDEGYGWVLGGLIGLGCLLVYKRVFN